MSRIPEATDTLMIICIWWDLSCRQMLLADQIFINKNVKHFWKFYYQLRWCLRLNFPRMWWWVSDDKSDSRNKLFSRNSWLKESFLCFQKLTRNIFQKLIFWWFPFKAVEHNFFLNNSLDFLFLDIYHLIFLINAIYVEFNLICDDVKMEVVSMENYLLDSKYLWFIWHHTLQEKCGLQLLQT